MIFLKKLEAYFILNMSIHRATMVEGNFVSKVGHSSVHGRLLFIAIWLRAFL